MDSEKIFFAAIHLSTLAPAKKLFEIKDLYKTFEKAYENINKITDKKIKNIDIKKLEKYLIQKNIDIIWYDDLPLLLKNIPDSPFALYVCGKKDLMYYDCFSVVGTRNISKVAHIIVDKFVSDLVKNSFVIVSGMASGIDTLAHISAMKNGGNTIAVFGNGIDKIFPSENFNLYEKLKNDHLIISEYPLGAQSLKYHFPLRNRIIAGLSLGTLVVEAKEKSGSIITAQLAFDYNREVFAVPGDVLNMNAKGTNWLIKNNIAKLADDPSEIFKYLNVNTVKSESIMQLNFVFDENEEKILNLLERPMSVEELQNDINIDISSMMHYLSILELKGIISKAGEKFYKI